MKPGDHVVSTLAPCGVPRLRRRPPDRVPQELANWTSRSPLDGEPAYNFAATSVFAERRSCRTQRRASTRRAAHRRRLIGCGVLTGIGAALNPRLTRAHSGGVRRRRRRPQRDPGRGSRRAAIIAIDSRLEGGVARVRRHRLHRREGLRHGRRRSARSRRWNLAEMVRRSRSMVVASTGRSIASLTRWSHTQRRRGRWSGRAPLSSSCVSRPSTSEFHGLYGPCFTQVDRGIVGCRYGTVSAATATSRGSSICTRRGEVLLDELVSATYPLEHFDTVVADLPRRQARPRASCSSEPYDRRCDRTIVPINTAVDLMRATVERPR